MNMQHIARVLGGDVAGRDRVLVPGPGHSAKDRSLAVSFLADGAFLVHSFAGDGWQACRDHVKARIGRPEQPRADRHPDIAPRRDVAAASDLWRGLWHETVPLQGTPGAIHLERRGEAYTGDALRWHPSCPFGKGIRHGCMIGLVRNVVTNAAQAIHRTAIDANGQKIDRMSLGPIGGGAVKLTDDADVTTVLAVGEGIETSLSIRKLPGLEQMPVWACLTAGNLAEFPALPGIESVWIAADNDASGTGQRAAETLARRLDAAGIEPVILLPRKVGTDLNDKVAAHV